MDIVNKMMKEEGCEVYTPLPLSLEGETRLDPNCAKSDEKTRFRKYDVPQKHGYEKI